MARVQSFEGILAAVKDLATFHAQQARLDTESGATRIAGVSISHRDLSEHTRTCISKLYRKSPAVAEVALVDVLDGRDLIYYNFPSPLAPPRWQLLSPLNCTTDEL
jgi:hypothetical protein